MDKQILEQYIDACEQLKDVKRDIEELKKRKRQQEQDAVKGSSHDFPYTMQTFHIEGIAYPLMQTMENEEHLECILKDRLQNAAVIKRDVEAWINTIPMRMQRIIRYRFFDGMTWEQVARKIGRRATSDSVRKEYENYMR